jgi:hypothetical protein
MNSATAALAVSTAIGASALTGLVTWLSTKATLASNATGIRRQLESERAVLVTQLQQERIAAREDRNQERRKEAYVALLKYVYWVWSVNLADRTIASRRVSAFTALREANSIARRRDGTPRSAESVAAERAAFFDVELTSEESAQRGSGPSDEERANTRALVNAVATKEVLTAFNELLSKDRDMSDQILSIGIAVVSDPAPAAADSADDARQEAKAAESLSEATMAARQEADDDAIAELHKTNAAALTVVREFGDTLNFQFAIMRLLEAGREFDTAVGNMQARARAELNDLRPVPLPAAGTGEVVA